MRFNIIKVFLVLFISLLFVNTAYSAVQVFSDYDTKIQINSNNTMDINKKMNMRNIHIVGIVPGRVEFRIGTGETGSVSELELSNVVALDRYGEPIRTQVFETSDAKIIALDIFTPILPGFEYIIDLSYTLTYDSSGLFFKNMEIPLKEDTSIDIQGGTFELSLPENYYFTYLSGNSSNQQVEGNTLTWEIDSDSPPSVRIEYSYLPINFGGIKGSYLFWILINIILLIILTIEIRKEFKGYKSK
jgi:hypothetical protein